MEKAHYFLERVNLNNTKLNGFFELSEDLLEGLRNLKICTGGKYQNNLQEGLYFFIKVFHIHHLMDHPKSSKHSNVFLH